MTMSTTPEPTNTTPPCYWDGESALFMEDSNGYAHILQESGSPVEIAERKWPEAKEAKKIRGPQVIELSALASETRRLHKRRFHV